MEMEEGKARKSGVRVCACGEEKGKRCRWGRETTDRQG